MVTMGLFAPLPLALMIPFMAGQSFAMGEAFGKGFQYGKRRVSAMTNEEFNRMSAVDHYNETTADIKAMIPTMKSAMSNFAFLQQDIIKELIGYIKDTTGTVIDEVKDIHSTASDDFRKFFGAPPTVAKLTSPAGINALIKFWRDTGILSAIKSTSDIFDRLWKLFDTRPPTNTVTDVFNWIKNNTNNFSGVGPPPPGVKEPSNEPQFDKDTRDPKEKLKAPTSIITEFNKLNAQIRAHQFQFSNQPGSANFNKQITNKILIVKRKMLALWIKYNLHGKVNTSYYQPVG